MADLYLEKPCVPLHLTEGDFRSGYLFKENFENGIKEWIVKEVLDYEQQNNTLVSRDCLMKNIKVQAHTGAGDKFIIPLHPTIQALLQIR